MNSRKPERIAGYLEHIVNAVDRIARYSAGLNLESFKANDMAQDAIVRQFEIIGEAARRIISTEPGFAKKYPTLELEAAYRMRNALAHGYDTVNLNTVWNTIGQQLPGLRSESIRVLKLIADEKHP